MQNPLYGPIGKVEPFDPSKLKENTDRFFTETILPTVNKTLKNIEEGEPFGYTEGWCLPRCIDFFENRHVMHCDHIKASKHFNNLVSRKGISELSISFNTDAGWTFFSVHYEGTPRP